MAVRVTGPAETVVAFVPPGRLMSLNDREHWRPHARRVAVWRDVARVAALAALAGRGPSGRQLPPSLVLVELPVNDRRRRDPANYAPCTKAIVDGFVDAGLWPDDTPQWVTTFEPTLRPGATEIVVRLVPRTVDAIAAAVHIPREDHDHG